MSSLSIEEKKENTREFLSVALALEEKEDVLDFFIGLLTQSEAVMFGRRIKVAKMLIKNKTYREIVFDLKVSNGLVNKTDIWLNKNDMRYKKVLVKYFKRIKSDKVGLLNLDRHPLYKEMLSILGLR